MVSLFSKTNTTHESLATAFLYICLISALLTISLVLFSDCFGFEKDYLCEVDDKINAIVEENISQDEKIKKVITYFETEKFYDNISGYENYNNNFKVIYGVCEYEVSISED